MHGTINGCEVNVSDKGETERSGRGVARAAAMQLMRQETKASHAIRIHVYSADSVQRHALLMP